MSLSKSWAGVHELGAAVDKLSDVVSKGISVHHDVDATQSCREVIDRMLETLTSLQLKIDHKVEGPKLSACMEGLLSSGKALSMGKTIVMSDLLTLIGATAAVSFVLFRKKEYLLIALGIFGAKLGVAVLTGAPTGILETVNDLRATPQGKEDLDTEETKDWMTFVINIFCKYLGAPTKGAKIWGMIDRYVLHFDRYNENIPKLIDGAIFIVELIISKISKYVLGKPYDVIRKLGIVEIDEWALECAQFVTDFNNRKILPSSDSLTTALRLYCKGISFVASNSIYRNDRKVSKLVDEVRKDVGKVYNTLSQNGFFTNGPRMEPVVVTLQGPSGIGKSLNIQCMLRDWLPQMISNPEELAHFQRNPSDSFYARQNEHKYFDGYHNQFATIFDDFGQVKDENNLESEYMELIRMTNSYPNILHMADLLQKGNTVFSSKLIVLTTNLKSIRPKSILEPDAVIRRMDLCFQMVPRARYCTELTRDNPDPTKRVLQPHHLQGDFKWAPDLFEFIQFKYTATGIMPLQTYSYDEMSKIIIEKYKQKESFSKKYLDILKKIVDESIERVNGEEVEDPIRTNDDDLYWQETAGAHGDDDSDSDSPATPQMDLQMDNVEETLLFAEASEMISNSSSDVEVDLKAKWSAKQTKGMTSPPEYVLILRRAGIATFEDWTERQVNLINMMIRRALLNTGLTVATVLALDDEDFAEWSVDVELVQEVCIALAPFEEITVRVSSLQSHFSDIMSKIGVVWEYTKTGARKFIRHALNSRALLSAVQIGFGLVGIGLIIAAVRGVASLWKVFTASAQSFTKSDRREHKRGSLMKVRNLRGASKEERYQEMLSSGDYGHGASAQFSCEATSVAARNIQPNIYTIKFFKTESRRGMCLFLKDNILLFPRHYGNVMTAKLEDGSLTRDSPIFFDNPGGAHHSVPLSDILDNVWDTDELGDKDLVLVKLDKINHHKNILKYFATTSEIELFDYLWAGYVTIVDNAFHLTRLKAERKPEFIVEPKGGDYRYTIKGTFLYGHPTRDGDCGSLLYSDEPNHAPGKLLAFHVAGFEREKRGVSVILTQDILQSAVDLLEAWGKITPQMIAGINSRVPYGTNFTNFAEAELGVNAPIHSRIKRSKFWCKWGPHKKAPARLKPFMRPDKSVVDPMTMALTKYSELKPDVDRQILSFAWRSLAAHLTKVSTPIGRTTPLTYQESAAGDPGRPFMKGIPRSTSAGYPLSLTGISGKRGIWGSEGSYDFTTGLSMLLEKQFYKILEDAHNEIRHDYIFTDFLKDELRSLEKANSGSTRLISGAPVIFQLVFRSLFMSFISWTMTNRITNGFGPGINPYSREWHEIAIRLRSVDPSKGNNILAGDFGNFDGSQIRQIHSAVRKLINAICEDDHVDARYTLWQEVEEPYHICGKTIYQWKSKLSSGTPGTTTINSTYCMLLFVYAWIMLHPSGALGVEEFWEKIVIIVFGDDHILAISHDVLSWFNGETIHRVFTDMGLVYTNATKTGPPEVRNLEEQTFLKRGFRYDEQLSRYVAPLELDTILEMPYWVDKRFAEDETQHLIILQQALDELAFHGETVWETHGPPMIKAAREAFDRLPVRTSYEQCLMFISSVEYLYD